MLDLFKALGQRGMLAIQIAEFDPNVVEIHRITCSSCARVVRPRTITLAERVAGQLLDRLHLAVNRHGS